MRTACAARTITQIRHDEEIADTAAVARGMAAIEEDERPGTLSPQAGPQFAGPLVGH
jgi:hypothetical protein